MELKDAGVLDYETELIYYALEMYVHQDHFDKTWIGANRDDYVKMIGVLNKYRDIVYAESDVDNE